MLGLIAMHWSPRLGLGAVNLSVLWGQCSHQMQTTDFHPFVIKQFSLRCHMVFIETPLEKIISHLVFSSCAFMHVKRGKTKRSEI